MNMIYYVEVNLICIAILLLMCSKLHRESGSYSTANLLFDVLIWSTVVLCASDIFTWSLQGRMSPGARFILEASNLIYYEALVVIGLVWSLYVRLKLGLIAELSASKTIVPALPFLLFTVVAITNPFTHFLFTIDSANVYARGPGIYLHWAVTWMYLIVPTIRVAVAAATAPNRLKKQELLPMLGFIAAPAVASLVQMLYYGITASQVGVTFSIILLYILTQDEQILTDSLTGLNNRRGLDKYLAERIARHSDAELMILMLDINSFKQVNDRYGHIVGDRALIRAAKILKNACAGTKTRFFLCRYGGDEFLLCGEAYGPEEPAVLIKRIHDGFAAVSDAPYTLGVSIGQASGICETYQSAEALIRTADEDMYQVKLLYAQSIAQTVRE